MAYYVAKHHVRLPGYTARPGEVFEEALDEDTVQRLLGLGAIDTVELPGESDHSPTGPEQTAQQGDNSEPENEPAQFDSPEDAGAEDIAAEIPEIDVMDGISPAAESAPKEKSTRKSGRSGGKAK